MSKKNIVDFRFLAEPTNVNLLLEDVAAEAKSFAKTLDNNFETKLGWK
jgi:hypothetical protein